MAPLPPQSPSTTAQYGKLISIFASTPAKVLEIDILPSSFPPTILHTEDPPSLGVPKALLIPLYLIAHRRFFSYTQTQNADSSRATKEYEEALDATAVILLWDPNHVTTANFRRRHLVNLKNELQRDGSADERTVIRLQEAIAQELIFLESFLTSPLAKHTKSSTLWSYRLWLLTWDPNYPTDSNGGLSDEDGSEVGALWRRELDIIMKAGERHPRNYYAWNYARDLFRSLSQASSGYTDGNEATIRKSREVLAKRSIRKVHRWCLQHPRDISGWGFLVFLLRAVEGLRCEGDIERRVDEDGDVQRVVWETREFVRKYEWRGRSIDWFLDAATTLPIQVERLWR